MSALAKEFHSTYGARYGYSGRIDNIRDTEFPTLHDMVYLDHTGSTLYSKSQLQNYHDDLLKNTYGNPHSSCPSSEKSSQIIQDVRQDILSFFNTTSDKYHVIFTSNATNAIKLVADNFQFTSVIAKKNVANNYANWSLNNVNSSVTSNNACYVYLQDNHTSIVGIREVALSKGVQVRSVMPQENSNTKLGLDCQTNVTEEDHESCHHNEDTHNYNNLAGIHNLFSFPAMSNFSGHKYPLEWTGIVQEQGPFSKETQGKWFVLLDAASFISTSPLDLHSFEPDFIPLSFYKLFGLPTGLGALLVSNRAVGTLQKCYFSGGTVSAYSSNTRFHVFKSSLEDRFEDGTLAFLEIVSLKYGFNMLRELTLTMDNITQHTFCLAQFVYNKLKNAKHYNGKEVCQLYCDTCFESSSDQGPIINLNFLRASGEYVGYTEVSKLAAIYNIHLRTGCFCNIGACQKFIGLSTEQLKSNLKAGHVCGDGIDLIDGHPTGSVRISFGYMSAFFDVEKLLDFVQDCFVEKQCIHSCDDNEVTMDGKSNQFLKKIFLYPIKSCAAFEVQHWEMNEKGLCYDREWLIVNESGSYLSQKRESRLCLIQPSIDLNRNILHIQAPGMSDFELSLDMAMTETDAAVIQLKICGTRVSGIDCGDGISEWLTLFLKKKCRLLRQNPNFVRKSTLRKGCHERNTDHIISLTNDSQLLIITETSCLSLIQNIKASKDEQEVCGLTVETLVKRFRPNLVIPGVVPYEEDNWNFVKINDLNYECCGKCYRCQMVCMDPNNGTRSKEPLRTLSKMRGSKIPFGVHLRQAHSSTSLRLSVGDIVLTK